MGQIDVHILDHLIAVVVIFILPAAALLAPKQPFKGMQVNARLKKILYLNNSLFQWIGTGVILLLWFFNDRPWPILGFSTTSSDAHVLWIYLLLIFVVLYLANTAYAVFWPGEREKTLEKWRTMMPFIPTTWTDMKWWVIASVSAGICEEIIFRGYLINYLLSVFEGSPSMLFFSITIPAVSFGIAHLYQGPQAVLKIVLMAFAFGLIFILTESLYILIIAHTVIDLLGGLLGIYITQGGKLLEKEKAVEEEAY